MKDQRKKSGAAYLAPELAELIESIGDSSTLHLFACECASLALHYTGSNDPRLFEAVAVSRRYAKGAASEIELEQVCKKSEKAARDADEAAFDARDAFEEGTKELSNYLKAFGVARAAFSANFCCKKPTYKAAANAAYEAWVALRSEIDGGGTLGGLVSPNLSENAIAATIGSLFGNALVSLDRSP